MTTKLQALNHFLISDIKSGHYNFDSNHVKSVTCGQCGNGKN